MSKPIETSEYAISYLQVTTKGDPYISYGISVTDFGNPSKFGFSFIDAIDPTIDCPRIESSMSASTTDGSPLNVKDGVMITPVAPPAGIPVDSDGITEVQVTTLSNGAPVNAGVDIGAPATFFPNPPVSSHWTDFAEGPVTIPPCPPVPFNPPFNEMRMDVNFELSGGGDIVTMNGRSDITTIPCPEFPTVFFPAVTLVGMLCAVMLFRIKK